MAKIQEAVYENLRKLQGPSSVQMQPTAQDIMDVDEQASRLLDAANPDERLPDAVVDKMVEDSGELYDGTEKEGGDTRNEQSFKRPHEQGESPSAKKAKEEEDSSINAEDSEAPESEPTPLES